MGNRRAEARNRWSKRVRVAMTIRTAILTCYHLCLLSQRQVCHGAIHFFFQFLEQARNGELGLVPIRRIGFAIARNELDGHPAKDVIDDRRGVADFGILRETGWLEALMRKLLHQRFERYSVLESQAR